MSWRLPAVLLLVLVALAVANATGLLELVGRPARLRDVVDDLGVVGPLLFVVLMTALVPLGVPGVPFVLAAAAVWSWPVAVAASLCGGVSSSWIGIVASRRLGRERLRRRLPDRLAAFDQRLTDSGIVGVVVLRMVLFLTAPADWLIGLSGLPLRTAVLGTAIGLVPPTVGYVALGDDFLRWLVTPVGLGVVGVAIAALVIGRRRRRAR